MRLKGAGFALVLLLGSPLRGPAQKIIDNPAKALDPRAGRVVTVDEVLRIEDTGRDYFFKTVFGIRVSPGGEIFVNSGFEQVIQFDAQGRFVRNLVKKGQGPGELSSVSDVFAADDRVYLVSSRQKILVLDLAGRALAEISLQKAGGPVTKILVVDRGTIFVTKENYPGAAGFVQCPEDILAVPSDGGDLELVASFPLPKYAFALDNGQWAMGRNASLIAAPREGRQLFLTHTPEYLIKLVDAGTGRVLRAFRRDYPRVRRKSAASTASEPDVVRRIKAVTPVELNDINDLHVVDGRLWVQTSTFDPGKGVLIDVFSPEGRFEDSFFLKWWDKKPDREDARKRFTFAGGFVFFADTTEDGLIVIRKGRLRL